MRNWNSTVSRETLISSSSFYSTYEELKLNIQSFPTQKFFHRFYSTYEELKPGFTHALNLYSIWVFTVPMRNWNRR